MTENMKYGSIDFMKVRMPAVLLSLVLIIGSLVSLATNGLKLGIDFTGGTLVELGYKDSANLEEIRAKLSANGFPEAEVANFGSSRDVLVRIAPREDVKAVELSHQIMEALGAHTGEVEMRRIEFVGPKVGDELTEDGGLAMLYALIGILIYVAFRFEYRFSIGSVAALVHDVVITLGLFSVLQVEFDLTVLAAILAVIGYSLNDTIVVFDRVRENFLRLRKGTPEEITNKSLNDMLSRTLMTSITTFLVLVALFFLGGEIIHGFALALMFGVVIGTYSSIYVASSIVLMMGIKREDLMPPEKEGEKDQQSVSEAEIQQAFMQQQLAMMEKDSQKNSSLKR